MTPPLPDAELVDRLIAGDEATFVHVLRTYHGALVRVAQLYVASQATAEEIAQETWLAVLQGLPTFERRSSFKTWLFRICANRAKTRAVRDKRFVPFAPDEEPPDERFDQSGHWRQMPSPWPDAEVRLAERELVAKLEAALADLPLAQRAVVTLRDVDGLDAPEVCALLEMTEANQRVLLHRGRARLRTVLEAASR